MISAATRTRMIATRIQNSQTRKFGTFRHMLMSLSTARQDGKYANDRRNRAGSSCEVIAGQCRSAGPAGGGWPNAANGRATAGVAAMRILVICRPRDGVTGAEIAARAPDETADLAR